MLVHEGINTIAQLMAVLLVVSVVYLFAGRKRGGFLQFAGLAKPRAMKWARGAALVSMPPIFAVGNGSIAPGRLPHGLGNVTAYPLLAFG